MKKTKAVLLGVILWSLLLISGCNFIRIEEEPRKPLEYSIVKMKRYRQNWLPRYRRKRRMNFN